MRRAMLVFFAALTVTAAVASACQGLRPPSAADQPTLPPVVTQRFGAITLHAVQTGWVRVKRAHRDLRGPLATRMVAILTDPRWTEWMPVTSYVVEHPEGVFVVDTGLTERMLDETHFACDAGTAFVYRHLLQFRFEPADRIDRRLASLGIGPERLKGVILTHRHADHTDGLDLLPAEVPVYVGEGDWPTHAGALPCRWPTGRVPTLIGEGGPPVEAMLGSTSLTTDGAVRVVPLHGHSPGHLGVLVQLGGQSALIAGDATFDVDQLRARRLAGIVEHPSAASQTLERIARQVTTVPTFLLLAHDPQSLQRFARRAPTSL